jgi:hypothetical protein
VIANRASRDLAEAVKEYARIVAEAVSNGTRPPAALPEGCAVTPTEVMIAVDALLRAAGLEVFEVQIWRSLGRGGMPEAPEPGGSES